MSSYTSFAVISPGNIGIPIIESLLAKDVSVLALTRPGYKRILPAGAKRATADLHDVDAVASLLKEHNVEVVISTVPHTPGGYAVQPALGDAAKKAGVKLFAPSEFGMPTDGHMQPGLLGSKNLLVEYLKTIGLPTTRFYIGLWTDWLPAILAIVDNGKVNILGPGDRPISWTCIADMAGFVAHVLTTLPPSRLENSIFRIQGDRKTLLDIGEMYGDRAPMAFVDEMPGPHAAHLNVMMPLVAAGCGSSGWDVVANKELEGENAAGSSNHLWEGHRWISIKEFHNL